MSAPTEPGPTPEEILAGGTHVRIQPQPGVEETVFVRLLPLKEFPAYAQVMEDEEQAAELFCRKEPGWAAARPARAIGQIVEAGERVNADFFAWFGRRVRRMERIAPGSSGLPPSRSTTTSPASVSAAD